LSHDRSFHDTSKRQRVDVRARRATDRARDARSRRFRATSDALERVDVGVARRAKAPSACTRTRRRDGRESSIATRRSSDSSRRSKKPIAGADAREDAREGARARARDAGCARR